MLITHVLRLTKWEWFKLRKRWMPWILLGIAVLLAQLGLWASYAAYHNDTVQEVFGGGSSSYGQSWGEEDGQITSVSMSCADYINGRTPPEFDQLTEDQRQEFLEGVEASLGDGACDNLQTRDVFRKGIISQSKQIA